MAIRHFRVLSVLSILSIIGSACFGIVAATVDRLVDGARQAIPAILAFVCSAFTTINPAPPMGTRVANLPSLTVSKVRSFYSRLVARVGDQRNRSSVSAAFVAA